MLWKCCTQYANKFGKLSSGHRTGKGQFSFQYRRKAMSKNAQKEKKEKWSRSVMSDSLRPHGHQAPPSMGFSRQEYWSGLPFPSPRNFPTQGLNPGLPHCRQTLYCLSHQGSQVQFLGRELRSCFKPQLTATSWRSKVLLESIAGDGSLPGLLTTIF